MNSFPVTVDATATLLSQANAIRSVYNGSAYTVYLGGPNLTTENYVVAIVPNGYFEEPVQTNQALYAISTAPATVNVGEW